MNENLKKKVLLITIIVSLAIIFVPIYFFALADENDDNKFTVSSKKIVDMLDGTAGFDADDGVGNDKSDHNNRVRTFDSITYTVEYVLTEKVPQSTSNNVEGRKLLVEVLIPDTFEANLRYGDSVSINMDERSENILTIGSSNYYYAAFNVPVSTLDSPSTFDFALENINSTDINNYNNIMPLINIKESTDQEAVSVIDSNTLPSNMTCEIPVNVIDPSTNEITATTSNVCDVTVTGREDYFVNMYVGNKKTGTREVPVGILVGLKNQTVTVDNETVVKGIKGLIIPKTISIDITNSNTDKLSFNENSYSNYSSYQSNTDYKIDINENNIELPEINNGEVSESINNNVLSLNINNIKDYNVIPYSENSSVQFYYFSTSYFLTTLAERGAHDYSNFTINLTSNKNNINNTISGVQILDSYNYVLGNYSSNIDIYESSLTSSDQGEALEYGKSNLNYGSDFTLKTSFDYSSLSNSTGDGLTSLTNYVKIDNDVFKLINDKNSNKGYNFVAGEVTSIPTIKIATETVEENPHESVLFGFGEWNSNYFEISSSAPSGCPSSITNLTKEQLMNLYGGPCIVAKDTVIWAYSPVAENDIYGNPITLTKGPLIVESTYVSYNTDYIEPGSSGVLELYGNVIDDYSISGTTHQIVTSGTAYGKDTNDLRYLGNESISGNTLLTNEDNFIKTNYNFETNQLVTLNTNLCTSNRCPVSGTSILISGIKVTRPRISTYKATNLDTPESNFYYYPVAIKVDASASKSDDSLRFDTAYVDIYLPSYMIVEEDFGVSNEKVPTSDEVTTLSSVRSKLGKEAPGEDLIYKVYHYVLTAESTGLNETEISNLRKGILSNFVIYADIDSIETPNVARPEIYAVVDFKATKYWSNESDEPMSKEFRSITPESDRYNSLENVVLYNSSAVITKVSANPNNIEKNGEYTFNMIAYNHSKGIVSEGYTYPTADLYYVLPYDGDMASSDLSSKIGATKYTVNFTEETISRIDNINDYKFYYATSGVPSNIISDEIKTTSSSSTIWNLWEDPTVPVENVIAIKVVKQSAFRVDSYFGSSEGLTVNVKTVGSTDGNAFYNSFHILATKPDNFTCDVDDNQELDYDYCSEANQTKANYISSASKTSVYERVISGFVFEDCDYNGIYTSADSKLKDIPVSLYKIDTVPENYDPIDPTTFVNENDTLVGATVTGENGNYYFSGLASGDYYVSYTIDNTRYIVTDLKKIDDNIPDSSSNNSSASLLPNTNKAISNIITFPASSGGGKLIVNNINLGLAIRKEMAISLNKYITEVDVTKNGKTDVYDYSNKNATQVSINVVNPSNTTVRVKYSFVIENTKYYPGYVGLIIDSMPEDMTFNPDIKENQNWVVYDNLLYYNGLSGKLLLPNEKHYFTLVLDLTLKKAGTYRNVVSARDLVLMGDELPVYDFSGLTPSSNTIVNNKPTTSTTTPVVIPVEEEVPVSETAIFDTGSAINLKMKKLAGNDNPVIKSKDTSILIFKKSPSEPDSTYMTDENIVSTSDSANPIYMWFSNGTIYWWSAAKKVYLNPDSSHLFDNLNAIESIEINKFDTSMVTNMESMFCECYNLKSLNLKKFNTSNVTDMGWMFLDCKSLTSLDLSSFDTSNVTRMKSMFNGCTNLENLNVSSFNTSNVTDMSHMFRELGKLITLDLSNFNTSNVTNMSHMFRESKALTTIVIPEWDTSKVTLMNHMFYKCESLKSIDISSFNFSKVTTIKSMFYNCKELTKIELGETFDAPYLTDMSYAFGGSEKMKTFSLNNANTPSLKTIEATFQNSKALETVDISTLDTSKVTDMRWTFYGCQSLKRLDLSTFDFSKVTSMKATFYNCKELINLNLGVTFNAPNLTDMSYTFCGLEKLVTFRLNNANIPNLTTMEAMFQNCIGLTTIDLSALDTSKVTDMRWTFYGCKNLKTIYVSDSFVTNNVTESKNMFYNDTKLIGGSGTTYNSNYYDKTRAKIDGGSSDPGYFTRKGGE